MNCRLGLKKESNVKRQTKKEANRLILDRKLKIQENQI